MVDNNMFNSLSDEQITNALVQYANVPSIVTLLNGIREVREANRKASLEALEVQAQEEASKLEFSHQVGELANLPPPPAGIYNLLLRWCEVVEVVEDTDKPELVTIPRIGENGQPIKTSKGTVVMVKETRYPKVEVKTNKWIVETNKGFTAKTTPGKSEAITKRAITVSKRSATNASQLELVGHFKSASQACEHLKLVIGADSANRVLQRDGYFTEPYAGIDYTVAS